MDADILDTVSTVPVREEVEDGIGGVPAEVYQRGRATIVRHLHCVFLKICDSENVGPTARTERCTYWDHLQ